MNKKTIILLSVLVLFLIIGGVSASETNTTDRDTISATDSVQNVVNFDVKDEVGSINGELLCANNNSDEKISSESANEILMDDDTGTFAELNKLIKTTPNELVLNKNYVFSSTDSCLEITKNNYVIDFNGHTVNANSNSTRTVIKVSGDNVVIKNMKFINGIGAYTLAGAYLNGLTGAIDWEGDNGVLDNISISNSQYAIGWHGKYGLLNNSIIEQCANTVVIFTGENFLLSNSIIRDNIHDRNDRSLIILNSYSTAYNCTFNNTDCHQVLGLGANSGQSNCKVLYCDFYNGYESVTPMAVSCSIEYCTFTGVSSGSGRAVIYLAGVSVNSIINHCNFTNCNPTNGGIVGYNNNNIFTISNSRFINNSAISLSNGYIISNCHIENNTFSNNLYGFVGTLSDCNFTNNKFTHGSNNHVILAENTVVKNCNFINNIGCTSGVILVNNVNNLLRVYDSNFVTDNEYDGWAITATVSNAKFYESGNTYDNKTKNAVSAINPDNTLLNNLWVTSKSVTGGDGTQENPFNLEYGVSIVDYGGTVNFLNDGDYTLTDTLSISKPITLNGNGATITNPNGLALNLRSGAVNSIVNYLTFKDCGQTNHGDYGAINNQAYCILIANSTFINNLGSHTGAISLSNGGNGRLSTIYNCTFTNNCGDYGAVFVGGSICTVSNSRFENNVGTYVGGIYVCNINDNNQRNLGFTLTNCNFTNNRANSTSVNNDYYGVYPVGGVSISSTNSEVSGCRFEKNSAYLTGALCMNKAEKITDCIFIDNSGIQYAGGVYMASDDASIFNCSFINNKQISTDNNTYGGGAIYVTGNNLKIDKSIFESNSGQYGSAIWTKKDISYSLSISNSNFTKHTSSVIDLNNYGATINFCNFINNNAQAIQCTGSDIYQNLVVSNSNFKFNNINNGNGVAINSMISTTIDYCNFINNTALAGILSLNYDGSEVSKSNFINNTASWASAILVNADNIKIKSSNFTNNRATSNDLSGSVYVRGHYTLITDSVFTNNRANIRGAAVYIAKNSGSERFYYYIDSFTTNTCGSIQGYNDIYGTYGQELMEKVYVILNPDRISGSDMSGIDENNPTYFEVAFNRVAPEGSIIFINNSETYSYFTIATSEHNKGDNYNGALFVCDKEGVKFCGKNTTFVNLRFSISSKSHGVEFKDITFTNCNNSVLIWNSENGIIDNCIFKDNSGEDCVKGGAIQALGNNLTIKNSLFKNNAVKSDKDPIGGGAIYCNVIDLTIINCNFTSNIADNGAQILLDEYDGENDKKMISIINSSFNQGIKYTAGGNSIILNHGNVIISNCNFTSNIVDNDGSAIYVAQIVQNVKFENNSFTDNSAVNGGAIAFCSGAHKQINIINNHFTRNVASANGGAIVFTSNTIDGLLIAGNCFKNNSAKNGGAIYTDSAVIIDNCNFTSNTATTQGGGLYLTTDADNTYIEDCNFTDNQAYNAGAVSCFAKASISGCNFKHNIATYVGGAAILNANVTVSNSNFTDNIAHTAGGAISIANADGNLTFIDCNFTSNQAIGSSTSAGAIYLYAGSLTISNCDFTSNNANNGGAIRISRLGVNTQISGSNFTNNNATSGHGGAIYTDSPLDISDSNLDGNNATVGGGALYLSGNVIKSNINDCNFTANTACINGGAIFIDGNNVTVINSKFTKNIATENGGAIYVAKNNAIITGCEFKENKAKNGSAIYIRDNVASATITDCNFTDNVAAEHGTVYLKGITSPLKLSNNVFSGNSPVGASENYYENPTITTASVMYVSSSGTGSGLTWDDPTDWNTALGRLENPGKIVLVSDISIASQTFTNQNITVTSYGDVRRKLSSSGKYLFIPLSQFI